MVPYLVSVGLVGTTAITLFAVASVSLLSTDDDQLAPCCVADGVLRYARGNTTAICSETYWLTVDLPTISPALAAEDGSTSPPRNVTGSKAAFEPAPDQDTSTTSPEPQDAALVEGARNNKTLSTQTSASDEAAAEQRPIADEARATANASQGDVSGLPDEGRQISHNIKIQQDQPAEHQRDHLASYAKGPAPKVEMHRVDRQLVSPDAALRYRVQKECGPIIFPKLYRHCVASFGVYPR
jgi:hypothetical protein